MHILTIFFKRCGISPAFCFGHSGSPRGLRLALHSGSSVGEGQGILVLGIKPGLAVGKASALGPALSLSSLQRFALTENSMSMKVVVEVDVMSVLAFYSF